MDSLRSRQDHVPGMGPTGWGWVTPTLVVTPAVGATAQPNALRLNLNSHAVSRPIEKECPWDSTVHFRFGRFGDELLFGTQHVLNVHFGLKTKMDL